MKFDVGDTVYHMGHGRGKIACMSTITGYLYNKDKYPYVVQFDCGYTDVYGAWELSYGDDLEFKCDCDRNTGRNKNARLLG